jgi:hypothetical protein
MQSGNQAELQLKDDAAVWAIHCLPITTHIEQSTIGVGMKSRFIPSNVLDLVKRLSEEQKLYNRGCVIEFNMHFCCLFSKLDLHQPILIQMLAHTAGCQI